MIRILEGDCRATLPMLTEGSVQACITSPPYYGLRSYIEDGDPLKPFEIGLEPTPEIYIEHMVECFREVRRVLRDDGCVFLNLGDGYAGKSLLMMPFRVAMALQAEGWWLRSVIPWLKRNSMPESVTDRPATSTEYVFLLAKSARYFWDADAVRTAHQDAAGGPERFGRIGANGGYQGGDSRNPDDEMVRTTFALKPGARQYNPAGRNRRNSDWFFESWQGLMADEDGDPLALVVNPQPFKGSHFATFPPKLVEPMVKASTSEKGQCPECGAPWVRTVEKAKAYGNWRNGRVDALERGQAQDTGLKGSDYYEHYKAPTPTGWQPTCKHDAEPVPQTILDPFGGSGTVGLVADRLGRNAVLCELKPEYAEMGTDRIVGDSPMFAEIAAD